MLQWTAAVSDPDPDPLQLPPLSHPVLNSHSQAEHSACLGNVQKEPQGHKKCL